MIKASLLFSTHYTRRALPGQEGLTTVQGFFGSSPVLRHFDFLLKKL